MSDMPLRRWIPEQDLLFLANQPVIYHCHHFNLFLDQSIDDALGHDVAWAVKSRASREMATHLIRGFCQIQGAETPAERLQAAQMLFGAMGHGTLSVLWDDQQGEAKGEYLHYGYAWKEKYGARIKRRTPVDAFAAGFAAAAVTVAFDMPDFSVVADEEDCVALRAKHCQFQLETHSPEAARPDVDFETSANVLGPSITGLYEQEISEHAQALKDFTSQVSGDERGLVEAFGVFVTMTPAGYYNRISFDALMHLRDEAPEFVPILSALLQESGHVCVFNTFGGILSSPEWEALAGAPPSSSEEVIWQSLAIARALGFGRWTLKEFVPNQRLVLSTPATYEIPYFLNRHADITSLTFDFFQGAAISLMKLAHLVDFQQSPQFTDEFYQSMFKNEHSWRCEETHSPLRGDDRLEVVVTVE